jgi:hypothetical protein
LSKRNVKLILKVLSDLEPLRGSSNKKTLYSTHSCVNWAFFGTRGLTSAKKGPIYTQTRQINYYLLLDQAIWRMHKKGKSNQKKTLQIRLFLCTSKWIFISGPSQLAHAKIIEKRPKKSQKSYSNLSGFQHLKMDFYFWIRKLGQFKKLIKIMEISPEKLLKLLKKRSKFLIFRYLPQNGSSLMDQEDT